MSHYLRVGEEAIVASIDAAGVKIWFQSPDGTFSFSAKANIGEQDWEEALPGTQSVTAQIVKGSDFIVPVKYLTPYPAIGRGWKIILGSQVYEVLSMGGRPPVETSGRFGLLKRIHTKLTGGT